MSISIRWNSTNANFDGVTDVSAVANYQLDPAGNGDNSIECNLPDGTNIGIVTPVTAFQQIATTLGNEIIGKSASLERRFGVQVNDFLMLLAVLSLDAPPAAPPDVRSFYRGTELGAFTVMPTGSVTRFRAQPGSSPDQPGLIRSGQALTFDDNGEPVQPAITLLLRLIPIDDPREIAQLARR